MIPVLSHAIALEDILKTLPQTPVLVHIIQLDQ